MQIVELVELVGCSSLRVAEHIGRVGFGYLFQQMCRLVIEREQAVSFEDVPKADMKIGPRQVISSHCRRPLDSPV